MPLVAVHHFRVWDVARGDYVIPPTDGGRPSKRTQADIDRIGGLIIAGTEETVDETDLDVFGRFCPRASA